MSIRSRKRKRQRQRAEAGDVYVPKDVLVEILHRLPLKSLARFKLVDKEWNFSISNPQFPKAYRARKLGGGNHQLILYDQSINHDDENKVLGLLAAESCDLTNTNNHDHQVALTPLKVLTQPKYMDQFWVTDLEVLGSYNGLVAILVISRWDCDYILWNPLIDKHVTCIFPRISKIGDKNYTTMCNNLLGLCYDSSSDAYVAVVARRYSYQVPPPKNRPVLIRRINIVVHLVNFKTGAFTSLSFIGLDWRSFRVFTGGVGTVVCGAPHWVQELNDFTSSPKKRVILYFSLEEKIFKTMEVPLELGKVEKVMLGLGSLNGERQLSVALQDMTQSCCFEVWVMKEYGNLESWTNLFVIQGGNTITKSVRSMVVLGLMENGEYLIKVNGKKLLGYDPEKGSSRQIQIKQCCERFYIKIVNEPSLIFPPQLRAQ